MPAMIRAVIAAALVLQSAPPTPAPDWRPLGSNDTVDVAWNAAAVERGRTVIVLVRFMPRAPGDSPYAWAISRVEFNCAAAEVHVILTVNYRADGSAGATDAVPRPFIPIPPVSLYATLPQLVC